MKILLKQQSYLALALVLISVTNRAHAFGESPMLAHPFQTRGPWFEGWYTRVTDTQSKVSFAVITTSAIHEGQNLSTGEQPPGYVAIVIRDGETSFSLEDFPQSTSIANDADDFQWTSQNGHVNSSETSISIGETKVSLQIESRVPWGGPGPEGRLSLLPLPLHWYVDNTSGTASYSVSYRDSDGVVRHLKGRGLVHQEKNWGQIFPRSWVWSQAVNDDAYLSFAGGDLEIAGVRAHSYMLGYRTRSLSIDFNLGQGPLTSFNDSIDGCQRKFEMTAYNSDYKLVLRASGSDFVELSIPTKTGYERGQAVETFRARIDVELYRASGFPLAPSYKLVEKRTFEDAALEFGAEAMTCGQR